LSWTKKSPGEVLGPAINRE